MMMIIIILSLLFVSNSIWNKGSVKGIVWHILLVVFITEWNLTCSKCVCIDKSQQISVGQNAKNNINICGFLFARFLLYALTNFIVLFFLSLSLSTSLSPTSVAKLALDQGNISSSKKTRISILSFFFFLLLPFCILAHSSDSWSKNSVGSAVSEVIVAEAKERKSSLVSKVCAQILLRH